MARSEIEINDFGGRAALKVTVTKTKRFAFRLWVAVRLIYIAARIAHVEMDYKELSEDYGASADSN